MFGLTFEKLLIIGVIAAFIIGPDRLPHYAGVLARWVRNLRDYANSAKTRMKEEMGPDFDDVEWRKLDPRQYDPRRIIRQALLEEPSPARNTAAAAAGAAAMVAPTMLHSGMAATPTSALEPLGGGSGENVDGQVRVIHFDSEAT